MVPPDQAHRPGAVPEKMDGLLVAHGAGEVGGKAASREGSSQPFHPKPTALPLLEGALAGDMPILCVAAGMHALNAALGGRPGTSVDGHGVTRRDGEEVSSSHRIYIAPGSKLAAIVGSGGFVMVNSRHSHGIKEREKSRLLLASAYSLEDGVIEALESPDHDWVIGVQFHPERRKELPPQFDRLFQGLVERAKRG